MFLFSLLPDRVWAQCVPPCCDKLQICITKADVDVWLVNPTDEPVLADSGELFGFNVGNFSEKPTGQAQVEK